MRTSAAAIPVDMVFTYVDGSDPAHREKRRIHSLHPSTIKPDSAISDAGDDELRFRDVGEITYSVNSVLKYLPWIRTIVIVTDNQRPPVAQSLLDSGRIRIVDHRTFIPPQYLPTFNNKTIESFLYRIEGLSDIFLYNNDDYMHFAPVPSGFFMSVNNGHIGLELHAYPAWYRWVKRRYSRIAQYRANLHSIGIANAYDHLRKSRYGVSAYEIVMPVHATRVVRKATAVRIEEEFGGVLEETRRSKFRDTAALSYDTILYTMERKWHPQDRLHRYLLGDFSTPHAMFDFPLRADAPGRSRFWQRVAQSHARLACINNVPPDERERFIQIMQEKGLDRR